MVLHCKCNCVIHVKFVSVGHESQVNTHFSFSSLIYGCPIAPAPLLKRLSFSTEFLLHHCQKSAGLIYMVVFLSSLFYSIYICVYLSQQHMALITIAVYYSLKISQTDSSTSFFKFALAILIPLAFHINFRIILCISTTKSSWDFESNCIKPTFKFEESPIHEHTMLIYLDFFSFISILQLLAYKSHTCSVRVTPNFF